MKMVCPNCGGKSFIISKFVPGSKGVINIYVNSVDIINRESVDSIPDDLDMWTCTGCFDRKLRKSICSDERIFPIV